MFFHPAVVAWSLASRLPIQCEVAISGGDGLKGVSILTIFVAIGHGHGLLAGWPNLNLPSSLTPTTAASSAERSNKP